MAVVTLRAGAAPSTVRHWLTGALAVAMTAAAGAAVLTAGWTDASPSALLMGVAGAGEALLLTRLRLPRPAVLVAPVVLLVVTVVLPTVGTVPVPVHSGVIAVMQRYAVAAVSGLLGNVQWDFNVGLGALLWACGAWAVEMAAYGHRGALATAPVWCVLAVNVINAPTPGNAALTSTLAAGTAVLLIAAAHLERLNSAWGRGRVTVLPGTDRRFAVSGVAGGVLILLLALALPPVTSTDISGRIFGGGGGGGPVNGGGGHSGGNPTGTVRFNRATVPGGPLVDATTAVLTYVTGVPSGTYLQMATDTVFSRGAWLPEQDVVSSDLLAQRTPAGPLPRDRSAADGGVGSDAQPVSVHVQVVDDTSGDNTLPFPGEPDASSVAARVSGYAPAGSSRGFLTVDEVAATTPLVGATITTTGTESTAGVEQLRSAGTDYPAFITGGDFLVLPDDGSGGAQAIRALAQQWTEGLTNPYDRATAIETRLRDPQRFRYTLDPSLPSDGRAEWPIVYFLTTSHAGYCQYFASAMGAMLRALGIPARLLNGYGPGRVIDSATATGAAGLRRRVTSDDAHTWVEGYFPGYGWIPFEPTPPSSQGDYVPFPRGGGSAGAATPTPGPTGAAVTPRANPRGALTGGADPGSSGGSPTAAIAGGAIGMGILVLLVAVATAWLARPRGLAGTWRRLGLLGRLLGAPRDPCLTLDEFAQRLATAIPPDTGQRRLRTRVEESLGEICTLSDLALYGQSAPSADETVRMRTAWRRIVRLVPVLGWGALRHRRATP